MNPWSEGELNILRELWPRTRTGDIARILKRSQSGIDRMADRLGMARTAAFQAAAKERRRHPFNWVPVGTVRRAAGGYMRIKTREAREGEVSGFSNTDIWAFLQRHVWEAHHGPVPEGMKIIFRDHNREHCEIGNLEMVTAGELGTRNRHPEWGGYPVELKEAITLQRRLTARLPVSEVRRRGWVTRRQGEHAKE